MTGRPIPRPCLDCGQLHTNQSRCNTHTQAARQPPHPAYNDPEYKRIRRLMLDEHIAQHGLICPGAPDLDHEAHPCTDLTIDHIIPLSAGPTAGGTNHPSNLRVLCQPANTAKGGTNRKPVG